MWDLDASTRDIGVPSVVVYKETTNKTRVIFKVIIMFIHVILSIHVSSLMLYGLIFTIFCVTRIIFSA